MINQVTVFHPKQNQRHHMAENRLDARQLLNITPTREDFTPSGFYLLKLELLLLLSLILGKIC